MTAKPSVRPGPPEVFEGTALKNAVGELERLGFDLAEATSTMRSEMAQSWLRSGKTLAQNPEAGRQLADQLKWNPEMGLTDDQSALLLRHKVTLENSLNDAAERTHTAKDPTARATAQKEYERLGNEFTELLDAIKHRGGEWGREGRWRQAIARENYSFTSQEQIARAYKAATGKDFTPQEAGTAKKIAGKG